MPKPNTTLDEKLAALPPEIRAGVERRGKVLADRDRALAKLRKLRRRSQAEIAAAMGIQQSGVSKLECKASVNVDALRRYVEAAGGRLDVIARFPEGRPVRLNQFSSAGHRAARGAALEP